MDIFVHLDICVLLYGIPCSMNNRFFFNKNRFVRFVRKNEFEQNRYLNNSLYYTVKHHIDIQADENYTKLYA